MKPVTAKEFAAILRFDPLAFAEKCFSELNAGQLLDLNWHIQAATAALESVIVGRCQRLIINLPPRSLKSFLCSVVLPAYLLGKDPKRKIICVSYSQDLADAFSGQFRRIVSANWFKLLFPNLNLLKNSENEVTTDQGGGRYATSVGGTLTGRGGDLILIDDPLSATDAYSKSKREGANEWCANTLLSRLDDPATGAIVLLMQRFHPEDLTGHLLQQGGWAHLSLPATAPDDRMITLLHGRHYHWKKGEPLHSTRLSASYLAQMRQALGSELYAAQYDQQPLPATGLMLKREWLKATTLPLGHQPGEQIVQSWDTASKVGQTTDYSACLTFLVRNKNEYNLLDVFRDRLEFPELLRRVASHAQTFRADAVLIEEMNSGTSLIQTLKRNGMQGIIGRRPQKDKLTRMYTQTAKLEAGSLSLPNEASWRTVFLEEYLAFPKAPHDDLIDCLSQFLEWQADRDSCFFEADFGHGEDMLSADADAILSLFGRR